MGRFDFCLVGGPARFGYFVVGLDIGAASWISSLGFRNTLSGNCGDAVDFRRKPTFGKSQNKVWSPLLEKNKKEHCNTLGLSGGAIWKRKAMSFDMETIKAFTEWLGLARSAIELVKGTKDLLPNSQAKTDATKRIEDAEKSLSLAEAQLAQTFGYQLCKAHWPPAIMLSHGHHPKYLDEIFKCTLCSSQYPSEQEFSRRGQVDRAVEEHNRRMESQNNW